MSLIKLTLKYKGLFFLESIKWAKLQDHKESIKQKFSINQLPSIPFNTISSDVVNLESYTFLSGNSLLTDIALIVALVKEKPNASFLEIGSFRGETMVNVAKHAKECVALTLGKEEMKAMGLGQNFIDSQGLFYKDLPNVKTIFHNSLTFDFSQFKDGFDVIFVDGDHSYGAVKKDTINAFKVLKDENSVIVWHDYGYNPEEVRYDVFAGIMEGTPPDKRKFLYHVANTMCAVYIPKHFDTYQTEFAQIPKTLFDVTITPKKP